jgi:uncharacterized protein YbjT (DUF2867 family)
VREGWEALRPHSAGVYANFLADEDAAGVQAAYGERERGATVRVFARDHRRAAASLGVELAGGDFGEPESIRRALDGIDRVFLIKARLFGAKERPTASPHAPVSGPPAAAP